MAPDPFLWGIAVGSMHCFLASQDTKFEKRLHRGIVSNGRSQEKQLGFRGIFGIRGASKSPTGLQMVEEFLAMFNWILKYLEYMLLHYVHLCTR